MSFFKLNLLNGPFYEPGSTKSPPESSIVGNYQTYITISNTNCSVVLTGANIKDGSKKALKFVKRKKETFQRIKNEIELLLIAQNPRILKIDDFFSYNEYVCIVTPYTQYGSVYDFVTSNYPNGIPEEIACAMMKQMIESIQFLHGIGIVHRDIKPGNFLIYGPNQEHPRIVLCDFGFARTYEKDIKMDEYIGTLLFSAPEVVAKIPYTDSIDIWLLAITLFFMLSGTYPFPSSAISPKTCKLRIVKGKLNYDLLHSKNISVNAIDLIQRMCNIVPFRRIPLSEALLHPWIATNHKQNDEEFNMGNSLFAKDEYSFNTGT